ncbi:hypothetical protein MF672_016125 [Actinomadura sp. ATCC 31491]|uniref:Uncharacterized protein n=1 Tax=Actinomadura luzonensis TaxID=2805427 RepID=A0ABT0FSI2_9ACTN|nr:hypothetical protein [Actinomadura luzonensis]MCK2215304.1 hypothetical protein [Actinomadura luzonensis]
MVPNVRPRAIGRPPGVVRGTTSASASPVKFLGRSTLSRARSSIETDSRRANGGREETATSGSSDGAPTSRTSIWSPCRSEVPSA